MSNDQALIQVNLKSGVGYDATLINVYAKTGPELVQLLEAVKENAPLIAEAQAVVKLTHGVEVKSVQTETQQQYQQEQPTQQNNSGWGAPQGQPPSFANPATQAPTCRHGEMEWKDFVSKAGNAVKGHFCRSNNRQDQCPPNYAKR